MAKTLENWLATDVAKFDSYPTELVSNYLFFRDPPRACPVDSDYFFAPADGTIVYQKWVKDGEAVVDVKGAQITVQDLIGDKDYNKPSLVIGIFMSFADVHVNRMPYGGTLRYKELEQLGTDNLPMLLVEKGLFKGKLRYEKMVGYLKQNQRMLNEVNVAGLNYKYYMVQIADKDVRVITPFTVHQGEAFSQNQRFSMVRWGSQVDLILPISEDFEFQTLWEDTTHVEAGLDPLVKMVPYENDITASKKRERYGRYFL